MHYPDGRCEYIRESLKKIIPKLPANFIQIHKSYVVNMHYFGRQIQTARPSGTAYDEYIELSSTENLEKICLPVGPKYRNAIMEYILNKYVCIFSPDLRAEEESYE